MRILFFTQSSPRGASSSYRVYQYLPTLRARGWTCWVAPAVPLFLHGAYFFSTHRVWKAILSLLIVARRVIQLVLVPFAHIVFIQKPLLPLAWPPLEPFVAKVARKVVFDFDDSIFLASPAGVKAVWSELLRKRFCAIIRHSTVVLAGNEFLAREAARSAARVEVLPTVVDTNRFGPKPSRVHSPLVVGWMGSPTTAFYPNDLRDVLSAVSRKFMVQWVFVGTSAALQDLSPAICEPWNYETEVEKLHSFDIFISPLRDSPWEQGKCALKTLTAMSVGLPVVASRVGVHADIIQDGRNGFLASSPQEWQEKLGLLISDVRLREDLGKEARKTVEENYSLAGTAPRLVGILKSL